MATYEANTFEGMSLPSQLRPNDLLKLTYKGSVPSWRPSQYGVKKFLIEAVGAKGADASGGTGGKGGYSKGIITVQGQELLYFGVGQAGNASRSNKTFGGGGAYGGGGATWVAKKSNPQRKEDLYLVGAGGGGGSSVGSGENGGAGGGLQGNAPDYDVSLESVIANQTKAGQGAFGNNGGFLSGADGSSLEGSGGGGGLYGGGNTYRGGAGGSAYIGGVAEGETRPNYNIESNGRVLIRILQIGIEVQLSIVGKQSNYTQDSTITWQYSGDSATKVEVKYNNTLIKSYTNPRINTPLTFNLSIGDKPNGNIPIRFIFYKDGQQQKEIIEMFTKTVNEVTLQSNTIQIPSGYLAVDVDLGIKEYTDIKIEVCNNAYDDAPTWEDNTNRILKGLNIYLTNKEKTNENWGLAVKITAAGEFRMSDKIRIAYKGGE